MSNDNPSSEPFDLSSCTIKPLSAAAVLQYEKDTSKLCTILTVGEKDNELALAISEHAALAFHCLYQKDKQAFCSPLDAAKKLTVNQLCDILENYLDQNNPQTEQGYNEGFSKALNSIQKGDEIL